MTGNTLRGYLSLCKLKIALFAALSAASGFFLSGPSPGTAWPPLVVGTFLLACGACALNQFQERGSDARMARTAGRPLPAGRVDPDCALAFSLILIASGTAILSWNAPPAATLLGLGAVLWYNGVYTWLKARNAFAEFPGALIGAVPPAIGWLAGGGRLSDPPLSALCFFYFMWQVPHFLVHRLSFGGEYEAIGRPSLTAVFTAGQLNRLTFQWLLAAAVSLQLVIVYGLIRSPLVQSALLTASLGLVVRGVPLLGEERQSYPRFFRGINYFMLIVLALFFLDQFPGRTG
jgi:protoheme IX farnesyltransferase